MRVANKAAKLPLHREERIQTDFSSPRFGGKPVNLLFVGALQLAGSGALATLICKVGDWQWAWKGGVVGSLIGIGLAGRTELNEERAKKALALRQIVSDSVDTTGKKVQAVGLKVLSLSFKVSYTLIVISAWPRVGSFAIPMLSAIGGAEMLASHALVAVRPKATVIDYAESTPRLSGGKLEFLAHELALQMEEIEKRRKEKQEE